MLELVRGLVLVVYILIAIIIRFGFILFVTLTDEKLTDGN